MTRDTKGKIWTLLVFFTILTLMAVIGKYEQQEPRTLTVDQMWEVYNE